MKSTPELEAEIVRLYYAEHWPVGTIATQLEAHVDQVRRVLALDAPRPPSALRPRVIDPYRRSSMSSFGGIRSCSPRGCTTWSARAGFQVRSAPCATMSRPSDPGRAAKRTS